MLLRAWSSTLPPVTLRPLLPQYLKLKTTPPSSHYSSKYEIPPTAVLEEEEEIDTTVYAKTVELNLKRKIPTVKASFFVLGMVCVVYSKSCVCS